jgi:hypothetical protein
MSGLVRFDAFEALVRDKGQQYPASIRIKVNNEQTKECQPDYRRAQFYSTSRPE